jgi:glycosyltransferase involved in cell wall biosynthesis
VNSEQNRFIVVVPFYNVQDWIKFNLRSVKKQDYSNFTCVLVDDISTDQTAQIIEKEIAGDDRFILVRNQEKKFALRNIYEGILEADPQPEDIIVTLDGDDWLSSAGVLSYLNDFYNREDCWLTYGSYIEYPAGTRGKFARQIPTSVMQNNAYRVSEWHSSHLRTFKYHLWSKIENSDLKDTEDNFYRMAWDLSFMFPMLEMCGAEKSRYIEKMLYVYNLSNPLNDHKTNHQLQLRLEAEIRSKAKYNKLENK